MSESTVDLTLSVLNAATSLMRQVQSVVVDAIVAFDRDEYVRRVTARMVADSPIALSACLNLAAGTEGIGE